MTFFQEVLMHLCLWGLAASIVTLLVCLAVAPAWDSISRLLSLPRIQQVFVILLVFGLAHYAATKHKWAIYFDGGIKQNPIQPSVVTNNLVQINWTRDMSGGVYIPESATVYIDYKPWADTNAVWQSLGETTVGAWHYSTMLPDATNYLYNVWAYYIPPEPVHTNGVWIYKTLKDRAGKFPIPLRARVEVNGKAIATPKEKRRDEGNE